MTTKEDTKIKYKEIILEKILFLSCSVLLIGVGFNYVDYWKVKRDYQQELFSRKIQCYADIMAKLSELPQSNPEFIHFLTIDKEKAKQFHQELLQMTEKYSIFVDEKVYYNLVGIADGIRRAVHPDNTTAIRELVAKINVDLSEARTRIRRSFQMNELIIKNEQDELDNPIPNTIGFHE